MAEQRTVAVLVNPTSGKGKGGRMAPVVARRLYQRGVQTVDIVGNDAESALRLAREAVDRGVDALVACGGDGTVHLAVQAVAGTATPLGVIPVGTGDDNARVLEIPRDDVEAAADVVADFNPRTIDVARVRAADGTDRWFLGVLSAGFDSLVNERANRMTFPKGQSRYFLSILAELRVFQPIDYTIGLDGDERHQRAMLVAVGNGVSYGGGMKVCTGAEIDDGLLTVTVLGEVGKPTFLKVFPSVYKGTHVQHPSVSQHTAAHVHLDGAGQVAYADGERIGPLPIDVDLLAGGLRVLAPRGRRTAPRSRPDPRRRHRDAATAGPT